MNSSRNLAIASILVTAVFGVMVACGGDDNEGGDGNGGGAAAAGTGGTGTSGTGGSGNASASGGSGGLLIPDGGGGIGDSSADSFDPDATCAESTITAKLTPANMLFAIDRTGSMNCNLPPTTESAACEVYPVKVDPTQPSKWEITRDALQAAWQGLQNTDPVPAIGVMFFNNDDYCGFPTSPDVGVQGLTDPQFNALVLSLNSVVPKGSTPIIGATMSAYQYMWENASTFTGNSFVVLLTDGAETCDLQPGSKTFLIEKAQEAASVGIKTFVLGVPGSELERAFLSQIAFAGGTPSSPTCDFSGSAPDVGDCHMDMTLPGMNFAQELQKNLLAISSEALTCEFDVPKPGPGEPAVDFNKINVIYTQGDGTEETIYRNNDLECSDPDNGGWQYADGNTKIILCKEACDRVRSDPQASISIELGCVTQDAPK